MDSVDINILLPLSTSTHRFRFMLVILERLTKLRRTVPLRRIIAYDVAVAFVQNWEFKYGPPRTLLSDNDSKLLAHFFQTIRKLMQITSILATTYHPMTNGKVERFHRRLTTLLRSYVEEHPQVCCQYVAILCFVYNLSVCRTTGSRPLQLVLGHPPPKIALPRPNCQWHMPGRKKEFNFVRRLGVSIEITRTALH